MHRIDKSMTRIPMLVATASLFHLATVLPQRGMLTLPPPSQLSDEIDYPFGPRFMLPLDGYHQNDTGIPEDTRRPQVQHQTTIQDDKDQ